MKNRRKFIRNSFLGSASFLVPGKVFPERQLSLTYPKVNISQDDLSVYFPISEKKNYFNVASCGPSPKFLNDIIRDEVNFIETHAQMKGFNYVREDIAQFVGVGSDEIALSHSTTEGIVMFATSLVFEPGDEIIISDQEHAGQSLPWLRVAERSGAVIKVVSIKGDPYSLIDELRSQLSEKTRVVVLPHITCTHGWQLPIERLAQKIKTYNDKILFFVDGAHGAGMLKLSLRNSGVDAYATCGHKWLHGPKGTGFLFVKREVLPLLQPIHVGAESYNGWQLNKESIGSGDMDLKAKCLELGTKNLSLFRSLTVMMKWYENIGLSQLEIYLKKKAQIFVSEMSKYPDDFELILPKESSFYSAIISFRPKKETIEDCNRRLKSDYRLRLVYESDLKAIRVSMSMLTDEEKIKQLVQDLLVV